MLLGASVVTVLVLLDTLWAAPLSRQLRRASAELAEREDTLNRPGSSSLPDATQLQQLRDQEAALRQRLKAAQLAAQQLGQQTSELPQLLRTLTGTAGPGSSLRLVSLELQPDPAVTPAAGAASTAGVPSAADGRRRLYRLPVTLTVSGSYGELQGLLERIERDAPSLQWSSVSLDSQDWPSIRLTLRAQAVSNRPTWSSPS
jgi:Tfp pilus assembly protein PilO